MKSKAQQRTEQEKILAPAREVIGVTQDRIDRINRILEEARRAEIVAIQTNRRGN